jgi:hypothetical protein
MIHSYRSIHQIFYADKKFGYDEIIQLQKYCMSNLLLVNRENPENINIQEISEKQQNNISLKEPQKILEEPQKKPQENEKSEFNKRESKNSEKSEVQNPEKQNSEKHKSEFWIPSKQDTLFWSIFITENGFEEFYQIGHSYGNRILEEKFKVANWIKNSPKSLKESNLKFTNDSIKETISEFMVDSIISFKGVAALSIYYKRPIFLVNSERKIYMKFDLQNKHSDEEENPIYIYYHDFLRGQIKYKIRTDNFKPELTDFFCLENYQKPLKAISNYKVDDLLEIANKVGYVLERKLTKPELYNKLMEYCCWS